MPSAGDWKGLPPSGTLVVIGAARDVLGVALQMHAFANACFVARARVLKSCARGREKPSSEMGPCTRFEIVCMPGPADRVCAHAGFGRRRAEGALGPDGITR